VLLSNTKMLALLRARGYVVAEGPDAGTIRLLVGASGRHPRWSDPHDRRRVLVEARGGSWRGAEALRAAGFRVLACPGPPAGREKRCPALAGSPCPLAAGADAIVVALPEDDATTTALIEAHHHLHPTPLCVGGAPSAVAALLGADVDQLIDR
jgi:hypothetical protein